MFLSTGYNTYIISQIEPFVKWYHFNNDNSLTISFGV